MIVLFLASLIVGLLIGVRAMLFGVERDSASVSVAYPDPSVTPTVRYWIPVLSAFTTVFGLVGYLFLRFSELGAGPSTVAAVISGVLASWAVVRAVKQAVAFVPEHDPDDPRYVLQGHVAEVTARIEGETAGEIVFTIGEGETRRVPARGIEGARAEVGSEVVIEKIEDGMAYVEPWAIVEKRI